MPLYEFRCESCSARFEALAPVGTESATCPDCGHEGAVRVLSAPAPPQHLVKPRSEARKQEARNAALQSSARTRFKEARRKARERRGGGTPPGAA